MVAPLREERHKLQTWFGVGSVLTLVPSSYTRRILNEQVLPGPAPHQGTLILPWCRLCSG